MNTSRATASPASSPPPAARRRCGAAPRAALGWPLRASAALALGIWSGAASAAATVPGLLVCLPPWFCLAALAGGAFVLGAWSIRRGRAARAATGEAAAREREGAPGRAGPEVLARAGAADRGAQTAGARVATPALAEQLEALFACAEELRVQADVCVAETERVNGETAELGALLHALVRRAGLAHTRALLLRRAVFEHLQETTPSNEHRVFLRLLALADETVAAAQVLAPATRRGEHLGTGLGERMFRLTPALAHAGASARRVVELAAAIDGRLAPLLAEAEAEAGARSLRAVNDRGAPFGRFVDRDGPSRARPPNVVYARFGEPRG